VPMDVMGPTGHSGVVLLNLARERLMKWLAILGLVVALSSILPPSLAYAQDGGNDADNATPVGNAGSADPGDAVPVDPACLDPTLPGCPRPAASPPAAVAPAAEVPAPELDTPSCAPNCPPEDGTIDG
jgi:hypothetical protein